MLESNTIKRYSKKNKKIVLGMVRFFVFISIIIGLMFIHELGHIIVCIMLGGEVLKVDFSPGFGMIRSWTIEPTEFAHDIVLIAGSITGLCISLIIVYIGYHFREHSIMVAGLFYYSSEFLYWCLSLLLGIRGSDGYNLNDYNCNYLFSLLCFAYYLIAFYLSFQLYCNLIKIRKNEWRY